MRSLPDQIKDCREFAHRNNLHIVGQPFEEKKSAKRAGQRKVFDKMLEEIRDGKYDAILAWAPDRLSRNMLEGGQLNNMLDEDELKDIRFVTHHFTNDASGKLTLGIMFSISKHFSDELSRKVSRDVQGNFSEGKSSGSPKHGYDRDDTTGHYTPNDFFDLIQEAWYKRGDGETYEDITKFLLSKGYHRVTKGKDKKNRRIIKPSKNAVAVMFRDPFYYGILVQANQTVDLRTVNPDFVPMIDDTLFNQVQALGYGRTRDTAPTKKKAFYPLRAFVYCGICNNKNYMIVGKNKSSSGTYSLSYRCDNPDCTRDVKSFRAKHVFNSIADMLSALEFDDSAYERYSRQIDDYTEEKLIGIREEVQSKNGALAHIKNQLNDYGLGMRNYSPGTEVFKINESHINDLAEQRADLEADIEKLKSQIIDPAQIKLSKEEFLNTLKLAPDKIRAGSAVEKDVLCRILFLNVRVDNEKVALYHWNEPFTSMVKATEINFGADERT